MGGGRERISARAGQVEGWVLMENQGPVLVRGQGIGLALEKAIWAPLFSFFEGAPLFSASARPGCGGLEGAGSRELRT